MAWSEVPSRKRLALAATLALTACASAAAGGGAGAAPALAGVQTLVADRMLFGQAIPGGGRIAYSSWNAFLRDVVTPPFPTGLTLWRAEGQWIDPRGDLVREPVIVIEVFHPPGTPADSVFANIAKAYMRRFHQDAVLRTTFDVRTQLYEPTPTPRGSPP